MSDAEDEAKSEVEEPESDESEWYSEVAYQALFQDWKAENCKITYFGVSNDIEVVRERIIGQINRKHPGFRRFLSGKKTCFDFWDSPNEEVKLITTLGARFDVIHFTDNTKFDRDLLFEVRFADGDYRIEKTQLYK